MKVKLHNDIARMIDPEAADKMEAAGYDMVFVRAFEPAFRSRKDGVWSRQVQGGCILALDYETLVERIDTYETYKKDGKLAEWQEKIYLPQRAAIVAEKNLHTNDRETLIPYFPK